MAQRNISLDVNGACPVNAFKALVNRIGEMEIERERGNPPADVDSAAATPDPAVRIVVTGLHYSEVYVFDITDRDMAAGTYVVTFVQAGI